MPSPSEISVPQLSRIIGLPGAPVLVDVRPCDDGGSDQHVLPTARQMISETVPVWVHSFSGRRVNYPNPFRDHLLANSITRNRRNSIFLHFAS